MNRAALLLLLLVPAQDRPPSLAEWMSTPEAAREIPAAEVAAWKDKLWKRHVSELKADQARRDQHENRALRIGEQVLRFSVSRIGEKPPGGWPLYVALHGGGQAPPAVNDQQWEHMKVYYRDSVKAGIYVATRGMSDTWNLHFTDASYAAYDRLIENFLAYEEADPNRVYLLGFSAGGDGTYQVAARMADRWAAANMSAGHPNGVSPVNLRHVAFQVQVGEKDEAYKRHQEAAKYHAALDELEAKCPGGYVHAALVHADRPHNFPDNDPKRRPWRVIKDPAAWVKEGRRELEDRDTNAVAWLESKSRPSPPTAVTWDPATAAPSRGSKWRKHYWLDLGDRDPEEKRIEVRIDRARNAVVVEDCGTTLRVRLSDALLDLSKPVVVEVKGSRHELKVPRRPRHLAASLLDRGDPSAMHEAAVSISKSGDAWTVKAD